MFILSCLYLLFFAILLGFATGGLIAKFAKQETGLLSEYEEFALLGFILGPVFVSAILFITFSILPGMAGWVHLAIVFGIVFFFILFSPIEFKRVILSSSKNLVSVFSISNIKQDMIFKFGVTVFVSFVVYRSLEGPVVGNDALVYSLYGKIFSEDRSFDRFPLNFNYGEGSNFETQHFPCLPLIYAGIRLAVPLLGDLSYRLVSPYYFLCFLFLMDLFLSKRIGTRTPVINIALVFCAFSPFLYFQVIGNTIDPIRICLIFLCIYILCAFIYKETNSVFCLLLISLTSAIFVHIGSILLIPVLLLSYILLSDKLKGRRFFLLSIIFGLFIAFQFIVWIGEYTEVYTLPVFLSVKPNTIAEKLYRSREIFGDAWANRILSLDVSVEEIIWKEKLQILSRPNILGLVFIIGVIATCFCIYNKIRNNFYFPIYNGKDKSDIAKILDGIIVCTGVLLSVPILYKFYDNYRYITTIFPQALYLSSLFITFQHKKLSSKYKFFETLISYIFQLFFAISMFALLCFSALPKDLLPASDIYKEEKKPLLKLAIKIMNFANWKHYAHPEDIVFARLSKDAKKGSVVLTFLDKPREPGTYFYMQGMTIINYRDEKFDNVAFTDIFYKLGKNRKEDSIIPDYIIFNSNTIRNLYFVFEYGSAKEALLDKMLMSKNIEIIFQTRNYYVAKVKN